MKLIHLALILILAIFIFRYFEKRNMSVKENFEFSDITNGAIDITNRMAEVASQYIETCENEKCSPCVNKQQRCTQACKKGTDRSEKNTTKTC